MGLGPEVHGGAWHGGDRAASAIPETVPHRPSLKGPTSILLDDCNNDIRETWFSVADRTPKGRFDCAFFSHLRDTAPTHSGPGD